MMRRAGLPLISLIGIAASQAHAQTVDERLAALQKVNANAERYCTMVSTLSTSREWRVSGDVGAELKGLTRLLAALHSGAAGEVKDKQTEGVLQQDLARVLVAKSDCKIKILLMMQSTLVDLLKPVAPTARRVTQTFVAPPAARPAPAANADEAVVSKPLTNPSPGRGLSMFGLPTLSIGMSLAVFRAATPTSEAARMGVKRSSPAAA